MSKIYEIFGSDAHGMTKALLEAARGCPPTAARVVELLAKHE